MTRLSNYFWRLPITFKGEYLKKNRKVGEKHVFENPHYGPFSADQCDQGDGDPISELLRYSVSNMSTIYYTKLPNMAPESTLNDIEFDKQVPNLPIFNWPGRIIVFCFIEWTEVRFFCAKNIMIVDSTKLRLIIHYAKSFIKTCNTPIWQKKMNHERFAKRTFAEIT